MSKSVKLAVVVVLAVIGVLALITGVIYLAVPFRHLPSFIPGRKKGFGAYHLRGGITVIIAVVLLGASFLTARLGRRGRAAAIGSSADGASGTSPAPAEEESASA